MAGSELDGLDGADGVDVRGRGLGADADASHRRQHVRERRRGRRRARRRRRRAAARAPRPGRRRHQPRAAPHRGDADGPGQRARRGARRAAAPRRRRLPRHDPHRLRPSGDLARHLRREPPGDPVGARRADRRARRDARRRRPTTTAPALHDRLQRAREARANLPSRVNQPSELAEVRIPIPDRPGAAAEVFTLAAELGVNIASFEVVHSVEGNRGVAVVLVDADDGRAVPRRADGPRATAPPSSGSTDVATLPRRDRVDAPARRGGRRCPGRRASPTARSSAPRWPTASRRCTASPAATTPRRCSTASQLLGRRRRPSRRAAAIGRRSHGVGGRAAARSGRRCRRAWPARRRGSSPRSPRSAGPVHDRRAAAAAQPPDGAAARRARRARAPTVAPGERVGPPAGHGRADRSAAAGRRSTVRGDVSSQYITALMLIAPYLAGGLRIELTTPLVSRAVPADHRRGDGRVRRRRRRRSATTRRRVAPARYRAPRLRGRARRQLGQLPAGRGGDLRRHACTSPG